MRKITSTIVLTSILILAVPEFIGCASTKAAIRGDLIQDISSTALDGSVTTTVEPTKLGSQLQSGVVQGTLTLGTTLVNSLAGYVSGLVIKIYKFL